MTVTLFAEVDWPVWANPTTWPTPVLLAGIATVLAGIDLLGAVVAKVWSTHRTLTWLLLGMALFALLFWVYAAALSFAELSIVTFGWIVILQVGVLLLDRFAYGVDLPPGKWVAAAGLLILQGYLVLTPNGSAAAEPEPAVQTSQQASQQIAQQPTQPTLVLPAQRSAPPTAAAIPPAVAKSTEASR